MSLSSIFPNSTSTLTIFSYLKVSHKNRPRLICGPAKNLRGPAVENH